MRRSGRSTSSAWAGSPSPRLACGCCTLALALEGHPVGSTPPPPPSPSPFPPHGTSIGALTSGQLVCALPSPDHAPSMSPLISLSGVPTSLTVYE